MSDDELAYAAWTCVVHRFRAGRSWSSKGGRRSGEMGLAFHKLHGSPAAAVAVYDPRLGAVIVATHTPDLMDGQVLDVAAPDAADQ